MACRDDFRMDSRAEQIEYFAQDAFEEVEAATFEAWETMNDAQRSVAFQAAAFGARVACIVLGETGTYEGEYQSMLNKLKEKG